MYTSLWDNSATANALLGVPVVVIFLALRRYLLRGGS